MSNRWSFGLIQWSRLCSITVVLLLVGEAARAEEPAAKSPATDWGALFRLHYQNRVKLFKEQNQIFRNVVLVGDSITEGFDLETYFPGRRMLNRGIGADVIGNGLAADDPRGLLKRLDSSIFDCGATDVFLLIGINDLNSGRKPDQLEEGYRELFKQIKAGAPRTKIYVQSLLPTSGAHTARNADVLDVNERLTRLADEHGFEFIDLHKLMVDDKGELKAEYTDDGLHLKPAAYRVWRHEVLRKLGWQNISHAEVNAAETDGQDTSYFSSTAFRINLCTAAGMEATEWEQFIEDIKGGTPPERFSNDELISGLTEYLLFSPPSAKHLGAEDGGIARPSSVLRACWPRTDDGLQKASIIRPSYITDVEVSVDGGIATGTVAYHAPDAHVGSVRFECKKTAENWRVTAFLLDEWSVRLQREDHGWSIHQYKQVKTELQ